MDVSPVSPYTASVGHDLETDRHLGRISKVFCGVILRGRRVSKQRVVIEILKLLVTYLIYITYCGPIFYVI